MSRLPAWQSPKSSIPVARRGLCGKLTGSRAREQMIGSMTAWGQSRHSDRGPATSGLPLQTDFFRAGRHLAKVPRSDVHRTVIVISTRIPLKTH